MTQSLRLIRNRIRSIENTRKVTSALELVSVSKLNKLERALLAGRPYFKRIESILARVTAAADMWENPLFEERPPDEPVALCVVTADSGLCGSYNNAILRLAERHVKESRAGKVLLVVVGKRGAAYFKARGYECAAVFTGLNAQQIDPTADVLGRTLVSLYRERRVGQVRILYTRFETALVQKAAMEQFLPLAVVRQPADDLICEPGPEEVLKELMPRYYAMKLRVLLLEALTSEYAARTVAMKMATDNAKELLQGLILKRNKVRQARITQDIMEIISSAEALKG